MARRVIVRNAIVAEYDGENVVVKMKVGNHLRVYVFSERGLTVTVHGRTEDIPLPWVAAEAAA